jgi:hypothetical protein
VSSRFTAQTTPGRSLSNRFRIVPFAAPAIRALARAPQRTLRLIKNPSHPGPRRHHFDREGSNGSRDPFGHEEGAVKFP